MFVVVREHSALFGGQGGAICATFIESGPHEMPLTDIKIKNAKHGEKPIKLFDAEGLFLLLQPSGSKLWRLKYRFLGKEKKLSLGVYPNVTLKDARRRRNEARAQIEDGMDPSREKKKKQAAAMLGAENTFYAIGEEYLERMGKEGRAAVTIKKSRWLLSLMKHDIGMLPIHDITPAELLTPLRKVEEKGHYETARRMRSLSSRIFRYAVATSRATSDPSSLLKGALIAPTVKHHSAILEPKAVGQLLRAIDGFQGSPQTMVALKLTPHVFVRPGELRRAEWKEFDLSEAVWTIPAAKLKMRSPHFVPLSLQALELLKSVKVISEGQQYVFSSLYPGNRPMSENTINASLRRIGYSGEEMTAHGFRSTASTLLNESRKWSADAIERALSHIDGSATRGAYHRGQHWDERVQMAQWWSDYLDVLRKNSAIIYLS